MAEAYSRDPEWWKFVISPTVFASFTVILLCRFLLSPVLVNAWVPKDKLKKLGPKRGDFYTYLGSTVHAIEAVLLAGYILSTGELGKDRIFSITPSGITAMQITLGYSLADLLILVLDFQFNNYLIHHICMAAGLLMGLYHQMGMYHIVYRFLAEFSTPFVNWRLILHEIGDKNGRWYLLASTGMTFSFFLCRIIVIPWHNYLLFSDVLNVTASFMPWYLNLYLIVNFTAFDILNVYWFWKIIRGWFKYLTRPHVD